MADVLDDNRRLVQRFMEDIWSRGNNQAINECLTEDFVFVLSFATVTGTADFAAMVQRNRDAFRNLTYRIDDTVVEEAKAAVFWTMSATHVGTWREVEGTNRDVSIRGMTIFYIRNGRIYEAYVQNDVLGLMTQIGGVAMTSPLRRNKEAMSRYVDVWLNQRDASRLPEIMVEDFVAYRGDAQLRGMEAIRQQMEGLWRAFPDLRFDIEFMIAEDDKVTIRFMAPGTHSGEFFGIPPTGEHIIWRGIMIYTFRDGLALEAIAAWNDREIIEQLTQAGAASRPSSSQA